MNKDIIKLILIVGLVYISVTQKKESTRNIMLIITGLLGFCMYTKVEGFNISNDASHDTSTHFSRLSPAGPGNPETLSLITGSCSSGGTGSHSHCQFNFSGDGTVDPARNAPSWQNIADTIGQQLGQDPTPSAYCNSFDACFNNDKSLSELSGITCDIGDISNGQFVPDTNTPPSVYWSCDIAMSRGNGEMHAGNVHDFFDCSVEPPVCEGTEADMAAAAAQEASGLGCMDSEASNYDPNANAPDGSCNYDCTATQTASLIDFLGQTPTTDSCNQMETNLVLGDCTIHGASNQYAGEHAGDLLNNHCMNVAVAEVGTGVGDPVVTHPSTPTPPQQQQQQQQQQQGVCETPSVHTEYDLTGIDSSSSLQLGSFSVTGVQCAAGYYGESPSASSCDSAGGDYILSGCQPCRTGLGPHLSESGTGTEAVRCGNVNTCEHYECSSSRPIKKPPGSDGYASRPDDVDPNNLQWGNDLCCTTEGDISIEIEQQNACTCGVQSSTDNSYKATPDHSMCKYYDYDINQGEYLWISKNNTLTNSYEDRGRPCADSIVDDLGGRNLFDLPPSAKYCVYPKGDLNSGDQNPCPAAEEKGFFDFDFDFDLFGDP